MKPGLKTRILTSVIGVPLIILILLAPVWVILVTVIIASLVALYEFYGAIGFEKDKNILKIFGYMSAIALTPCCFLEPKIILICVFLFFAILCSIMLASHKKIMFTDISLLITSLIYIPFLLSHILFTRMLEFGNILVWLVFVGSFMSDTCAYFAGKTLGKHKLCPSISPKKTIEGAVGGVVGTGIFFLIFALIINTFITPWLGGMTMSYLNVFILGLIASVFAQLGDLTASLIKRQFGIKDFGNLFPGHGGMLDRCDSIVFVAPVIFLFASNFSLFI